MIALTYFRGVKNPSGELRRASWESVCKWLSRPVVEYTKEACGGFSLAEYAGNRRALANVREVHALGLDFDERVDLATLPSRFSRYAAFVHTTYSSTPGGPRCRAFVLLSRSVTGDEYRLVYSAIASLIEKAGLVVDRAASDPSRFWYRPAVPLNPETYQCWQYDGAPIDVERAIALAPKPEEPLRIQPVHNPTAGADLITRAEKYLASIPPAISGQGGHSHTFVVAQKLVRGFGLDEGTALSLLSSWNQHCQPPWSVAELKRKIRQASSRGQMVHGALRDRDRRSA